MLTYRYFIYKHIPVMTINIKLGAQDEALLPLPRATEQALCATEKTLNTTGDRCHELMESGFMTIRRWGSYYTLLLALLLFATGCNYPEPLNNAWDIMWASSNTKMIAIANLPIKDYPLLAKFQNLKRIQFFKQGRSGADNAKLVALSLLKFNTLRDIELLAATDVTDQGLEALARIPPLRSLQLEGTSITDHGCEIISSKMRLTGVNVANCKNITYKGIQTLATSDTLEEIGFSADGLTTDEVIQLIKHFKNANWCGIVDAHQRLDEPALRAAADKKHITLVIKKTGALQNMGGDK